MQIKATFYTVWSDAAGFHPIEKALDPEQHLDFIRLRQESETYARAAATAAVERSEFIRIQEELDELKKLEQNIPELVQVLMRSPEAMKL